MLEYLGTIVAIGGLLFNLIGSAVIITRSLAKLEIALLKALADERKEIDAIIDIQARQFGETAAALRQKINELELYLRDNYVRRDGFDKVKDELTAAIDRLGDKLSQKVEKLEAKIEKRGHA